MSHAESYSELFTGDTSTKYSKQNLLLGGLVPRPYHADILSVEILSIFEREYIRSRELIPVSNVPLEKLDM